MISNAVNWFLYDENCGTNFDSLSYSWPIFPRLTLGCSQKQANQKSKILSLSLVQIFFFLVSQWANISLKSAATRSAFLQKKLHHRCLWGSRILLWRRHLNKGQEHCSISLVITLKIMISTFFFSNVPKVSEKYI